MVWYFVNQLNMSSWEIFLLTIAAIASSRPSAMALIHHPSALHIRDRRRSTFCSLSRREKPRLWSSRYKANAEHDDEGITPQSSSSNPQDRVCVAFPGGGLFFYWQAGVIAYLQQEGYNLSSQNAILSGASAGALSATLAKTGVDPYHATTLALSMSDEAGIWDRPSGLQGIWGEIIHDWLDRLLPANANERAEDELHILVTPVPSFGKRRISKFENRQDLINANMASVHLPWFLDGNLTACFRGTPYIDGSFLARPSDYFDEQLYHSREPTLIIDFKSDPVIKDRALEFIKVVSKQTIWDILEQGKRHAKIMDKKGNFDTLPRH